MCKTFDSGRILCVLMADSWDDAIIYTHVTLLPNWQVDRFHIPSYLRHHSEYDASASQMPHEQIGGRYYLLLQPWPPPEKFWYYEYVLDFKFLKAYIKNIFNLKKIFCWLRHYAKKRIYGSKANGHLTL